MERLENKILDIIKRWRDKQLKKKILAYKTKLNEKEKPGETKQDSGDKLKTAKAK